jgi:hypothetical protein
VVVRVVEAIIASLLWTLITPSDYNKNGVYLAMIALNIRHVVHKNKITSHFKKYLKTY